MAERRRTFGPLVLIGLATAGLSAVAGSKPWFGAAGGAQLMPGVRDTDRAADSPVALALSLVVLAGWGALLVTRGAVRRVVATIAVLAAAGTVVAVATAPSALPDQVRAQLPGADAVPVDPTGWYFTAAVTSVLALVAVALAWWLVPAWPVMGTRYDAPADQRADAANRPVETERDLWTELDAGRDPTAGAESGPGEDRRP